jgi:hypothetical protein
MNIKVKELTPSIEQAILNNYRELNNPQAAPFCVDGRRGPMLSKDQLIKSQLYPQTLGGDLNAAILEWLFNGGQVNFLEQLDKTLSNLQTANYQLGAHTGQHAKEEHSDCGFADQMPAIIANLKNYSKEIFSLITQKAPHLNDQKDLWQEANELIKKANLAKIPSGKQLIEPIIKRARNSNDAFLQILEGEHQELAAVVNLKYLTTLDVDNNQAHQAFNLDLWYLEKQMQALGYTGKKLEQAKLLTLGLYLATEIKLVEQNPNKGYRLPLIIKQ